MLSLVGVQATPRKDTQPDDGVRRASWRRWKGKRRDPKGQAGLHKGSSHVFGAEELTHAKSCKQETRITELVSHVYKLQSCRIYSAKSEEDNQQSVL